MVSAPPITNEVVPHDALPVQVTVPVATLASVFTPEKYGMFPTTALLDVPIPAKVRVGVLPPVDCIGNVPVTDVTAEVINPGSLVNQESLIVDEETVEVIPFVPVKRNPCVSDGRKSDELKVDDAVEKRPFEKPIVVPVAL
jgi:hypothetical protein